jgi:hypothetical protein
MSRVKPSTVGRTFAAPLTRPDTARYIAETARELGIMAKREKMPVVEYCLAMAEQAARECHDRPSTQTSAMAKNVSGTASNPPR